MADQFTETSSRGFFSRLMGSFVGLLIGPLLVIGAVVLLSWNEGRAVQALQGLGEAAHSVVEGSPDAVSAGNDGKLVHVTGAVATSAGVSDSDLDIAFKDQVAVQRIAEMYQWREKKEEKTHDQLGGGQEKVTTYTYEKVWSASALDSSQFKHPDEHANPGMPFSSTRMTASDAKLGGYTLDADTLKLANLGTALTPDAPDGWTAADGALVKGDPSAPKVGDMRVSYKGLATGSTLTVLAQQNAGGFAPFVTKNGYHLEMVETGSQPVAAMTAEKKHEETTMTWILRGVGLVVMVIGFAMFLGPLSTFAAVIPFLGSIIGGAAGLVALILSLPLTLVVIAISWITFRPLVGGGLLVAAAVALYGLHTLRKSQGGETKTARAPA